MVTDGGSQSDFGVIPGVRNLEEDMEWKGEADSSRFLGQGICESDEASAGVKKFISELTREKDVGNCCDALSDTTELRQPITW